MSQQNVGEDFLYEIPKKEESVATRKRLCRRNNQGRLKGSKERLIVD